MLVWPITTRRVGVLIWDFTKLHSNPTFGGLVGLFQDQINRSTYYSSTGGTVVKLVQGDDLNLQNGLGRTLQTLMNGRMIDGWGTGTGRRC